MLILVFLQKRWFSHRDTSVKRKGKNKVNALNLGVFMSLFIFANKHLRCIYSSILRRFRWLRLSEEHHCEQEQVIVHDLWLRGSRLSTHLDWMHFVGDCLRIITRVAGSPQYTRKSYPLCRTLVSIIS